MIRIANVAELYGMVSQLLIEVVCPHCNNITISPMDNAERLLVFGCFLCANIEESTLFNLVRSPPPSGGGSSQ